MFDGVGSNCVGATLSIKEYDTFEKLSNETYYENISIDQNHLLITVLNGFMMPSSGLTKTKTKYIEDRKKEEKRWDNVAVNEKGELMPSTGVTLTKSSYYANGVKLCEHSLKNVDLDAHDNIQTKTGITVTKAFYGANGEKLSEAIMENVKVNGIGNLMASTGVTTTETIYTENGQKEEKRWRKCQRR